MTDAELDALQQRFQEYGPYKVLLLARAALVGPVADGFARRAAVSAIDGVLRAAGNEMTPAELDALLKKLAERLREVRAIRRDRTPLHVVIGLCSEAADGIQSLRADNERLTTDNSDLRHDLERYQTRDVERLAEIERLRALLKAADALRGEGYEPRPGIAKVQAYDAARAAVDDKEPSAETERLRADAARLQSGIDRLMLEFCPDEMTPAQRNEWAAHQIAMQEPQGIAFIRKYGDPPACPHGVMAGNCPECNPQEPPHG